MLTRKEQMAAREAEREDEAYACMMSDLHIDERSDYDAMDQEPSDDPDPVSTDFSDCEHPSDYDPFEYRRPGYYRNETDHAADVHATPGSLLDVIRCHDNDAARERMTIAHERSMDQGSLLDVLNHNKDN